MRLSPNGLLNVLPLRCLLDHSHSFNGDQCTTAYHLVQDRQQSVNVRFVVDHFDEYRQVR